MIYVNDSAAMTYWESRLSDKIKEQLELDFQDDFDVLNPHIVCCTLENYISQGKEYNKMPNIRATVVCEPFFFLTKALKILPELTKIVKKATKPLYIISVMNDIEALDKLVNIEPLVRVMTLFCLHAEEKLLTNIRADPKGNKLDTAKLKQIFYLVSSTPLVKQIKGDLHEMEITNSSLSFKKLSQKSEESADG